MRGILGWGPGIQQRIEGKTFGGKDLCDSVRKEAKGNGDCCRYSAGELGIELWHWI